MDLKVNSKDEEPPHRHRKGWGFSFFGGSTEEEDQENHIQQTGLSDSCYPLSQVTVGKRVWVVGFDSKGGMNRILSMGLTVGVELEVISSQPSGSVLVGIQDNRIGIGAKMAKKILVSDEPLKDKPENLKDIENRTYLREMPIGTVGRVVGYEKALLGYRGKLLSMGLTPGTEFTVIRVAPLGAPVEINLRGFHLSLRKQEADALVVEEVNSDE